MPRHIEARSAHGVSPAVREASKLRKLRVIDATCPLVAKVHLEAIRYAKTGHSIILIGHRNHDEVIGSLGEAPEVTQVVCSVEEVQSVKVPDPTRVAYITQTTLSVDETKDIVKALHSKFPLIEGPHAQDICYATQNRQTAVKDVAHQADLLLVVGSQNSSNSHRMVEISVNIGTPSYLIDSTADIRPEWLHGARIVALTGGASAPEVLIEQAMEFLKEKGFSCIKEIEVIPENVRFGLPPEIAETISAFVPIDN